MAYEYHDANETFRGERNRTLLHDFDSQQAVPIVRAYVTGDSSERFRWNEDDVTVVSMAPILGSRQQQARASSALELPPAMSSAPPNECVGTLLVHQRDMMDLTAQVKDDDKVEAVGTLLVHTKDLQELSQSTTIRNGSEDESDNPGGLIRRITKTLNAPAPDVDEADLWGS